MDSLLDQFEALCEKQEFPAITEWLTRVPADRAETFVLEALAIELFYRNKFGRPLAFGDYARQLPGYLDVIERAFQETNDGKQQFLCFRDSVNNPISSYSPAGPTETIQSVGLKSQFDHGTLVAGDTIGSYQLLQPLGEGGMGSVWLAQQAVPVRRNVALKVIKFGINSREVLRRFDAERQALALMDHPNIARIIDAGETTSGQPFFAMELVNGLSLTEYCDQHKLPINDRLKLFLEVCAGVQHAHQKGIIHRDLKPNNILVATVDGKPVPKVIDFGLAKAMELTDRSSATGFGQILGTFKYMSPEQAFSDSQPVDTRADVYALGAILYELLTGSTPLDERMLCGIGTLKLLEAVRTLDPLKPSSRLSEASETSVQTTAARSTDSFRLKRLLSGDLDWVVMKSLEKERHRRYGSVFELAAEVERYLLQQPVLARKSSRSYRFSKFVKRNPFPVSIATILLLSVMGAIWMMARIQHDRRALLAQRSLSNFVAIVNQRIDARPGWTWKNREQIAALVQANQGELAFPPLRSELAACFVAADLRELGTIMPRQSFYDVAFLPGNNNEFLVCDAKGTFLADRHFHRVRLPADFAEAEESSDTLDPWIDISTYDYPTDRQFEISNGFKQDGGRAIVISPDQEWMALGTRAGAVRLRKLDDLQQDRQVVSTGDGAVKFLEFSRDSKQFFVLNADLTLSRFSFDSEWSVSTSVQLGENQTVAWNPDNQQILVSSGAVYDANLALIRSPHLKVGIHQPTFAPASFYLACVDGHQLVQSYSEDDQQLLGTMYSPLHLTSTSLHRGAGRITFDCGGTRLCSGCDEQIRVWNLLDKKLMQEFRFGEGGRLEGFYSDLGERLVLTCPQGLKLLEIQQNRVASPAFINPLPILTLRYIQRAGTLVSVAGSRSSGVFVVAMWDAVSGRLLSQHSIRRRSTLEEFCGLQVDDSDEDSTLHVLVGLRHETGTRFLEYQWDQTKRFKLRSESAVKFQVARIFPVADLGLQQLLLTTDRVSLERYDMAAKKIAELVDFEPLEKFSNTAKVTDVVVQHEQGWLTTESGDLISFRKNAETTWPASIYKISNLGLTTVAISGDGKWVAVGAVDGSLRIVDSQSGRTILSSSISSESVTALHWVGQGQICVGDAGGRVTLWDYSNEQLTYYSTLCDLVNPIRQLAGGKTNHELLILAEESYGAIRFDLTNFHEELRQVGLH